MGVLGKERTQSTGGLPAIFRKEHGVGSSFHGKIVDAKVRQRTDDDGQLLTWSDGNPQEELVIAIQTDQRDPGREDDTGLRGFYIKWWGQQKKAVLEALDAAGAEDIEIGGYWAGSRSGQGEQPKDPKQSRPWLYKFEYKAPSSTAGLIDTAKAESAPTPSAAPAAPPAEAPAAAVSAETIGQAKQMIAMGLPNEAIKAALPGVSAELLNALRNAG